MRKRAPATNPALSAALAGLWALGCTASPPAPATDESDAVAAAVTAAITTDALMTYAAAITRHARPSGSPGENAAIDTIVAVLEERGVPVTVHQLRAYASDPVAASVTIAGADFAPAAITMSYSASTPADGVVGEAVDMGALADLPRLETGTGERLVVEGEDFGAALPAGASRPAAALPDLTGKVAIVDGQPRNVPTTVLERLGAAAVVFVNPEERLNELIVTSTWGSPSLMNYHRLPRIPTAQIMRSAGQELRRRMAAGPVQLRVATEVATGWKTMRLAVARIEPGAADAADRAPGGPGAADRDLALAGPAQDDGARARPGPGPGGGGRFGEPMAPYVLLGGHIDGWHHGATDEAASNAAMLALALAFHDVRDRLRRGLVVAWWPGHSNARYAGSTWFADEFFSELRAHALAYSNIDGVGQTGAARFGASASEALAPFAARVVARTQGAEISPSRPGRNSDQSFNGIGLPLVQFNHTRLAEDGGYWWWHTTEDTFDKIDGAVLKTDTDLYAQALAEMLAAPRYPASAAAQVDALTAAIARREAEAEGALELDRRLEGRLTALGDLADRLDAAADAGRATDRDLVAFLRPLHRVMYVPHSNYHPDPGMSLGPLPGLGAAGVAAGNGPVSARSGTSAEGGAVGAAGGAAGAGPARGTLGAADRVGFALPTLVRERNRLVEAIDEALFVGEWALRKFVR